jgi:hypothetical protein
MDEFELGVQNKILDRMYEVRKCLLRPKQDNSTQTTVSGTQIDKNVLLEAGISIEVIMSMRIP